MINSYEELLAVADKRREETLTIEVDMGAVYSQPHEDAKRELKQAEALSKLSGEGFLSDNIEKLKERVAETRPEANSVWLRFRRLDISTWALLMKQNMSGAVEQYEKLLPKVFIGVFNDPEAEEALTTDYKVVSTSNPKSILPGGVLNAVIQNFMAWQNSGGEVSIHPTNSGQD